MQIHNVGFLAESWNIKTQVNENSFDNKEDALKEQEDVIKQGFKEFKMHVQPYERKDLIAAFNKIYATSEMDFIEEINGNHDLYPNIYKFREGILTRLFGIMQHTTPPIGEK